MSADPRIERLVDMSDGELYSELGRELLGGGAGFGGEDLARARRYARQWFDERLEQLTREVCSNRAVRQMLEHETGDRLTEIAVVVDAMDSLNGHPSAVVVAVIVVRRGLEALCSGR